MSKRELLSGRGDSQLQRKLFIRADGALPALGSTSKLKERLQVFLPQLEQANEKLLKEDRANIGSAVEVEAIDDQDESSDDSSSPDGEPNKVQLTINLFPVEDDSDCLDLSNDKKKDTKKKAVQEIN